MANKSNKEETATVQVATDPETQAAAQTAPVTDTDTKAAADEKAVAAKKAEKKATTTVKEEKQPKSAASVLENVGKAAIARHGFKEVFVTSDGLAFPLRTDAQHHAADLANKDIIKVPR